MDVKQVTVWLAPTAGTQHATETEAVQSETRVLAGSALAEVDEVLDTCLESKVCAYDLAVEFVRQLRRQGILDHVIEASKDAGDK